ncbi:hypothetical protein ALI144C_08785 [Actinosynnema sp. ALI-1.44]|nr:hypothetical protein ALI144C_08785 [Actinosynnema sp. ALI-1.44]
MLYIGIQVKRNKIDASAESRGSDVNVGIVFNQILMMLDNGVLDQGLNSKVFVDHVLIVSGGEITKSAQNWLNEKLVGTGRRQIMYMGREKIVTLWLENNLPVPRTS